MHITRPCRRCAPPSTVMQLRPKCQTEKTSLPENDKETLRRLINFRFSHTTLTGYMKDMSYPPLPQCSERKSTEHSHGKWKIWLNLPSSFNLDILGASNILWVINMYTFFVYCECMFKCRGLMQTVVKYIMWYIAYLHYIMWKMLCICMLHEREPDPVCPKNLCVPPGNLTLTLP